MHLDPDAILWSAPEREREGRPLLVLLHGLGGDEGDLFQLAPYLPLEFAVASVRAPRDAAPGYAWFPRDPDEALARHADESVDALITWLAELPPHPSIGLLGFSQGGAAAVHTLRRAPHAVDYAVSLAGFLADGPRPTDAELARRRPPLFVGSGDADDVIPRAWSERLAAWAGAHTTLESRVYHGLAHAVSEEELADVNAFLRARLTG